MDQGQPSLKRRDARDKGAMRAVRPGLAAWLRMPARPGRQESRGTPFPPMVAGRDVRFPARTCGRSATEGTASRQRVRDSKRRVAGREGAPEATARMVGEGMLLRNSRVVPAAGADGAAACAALHQPERAAGAPHRVLAAGRPLRPATPARTARNAAPPRRGASAAARQHRAGSRRRAAREEPGDLD